MNETWKNWCRLCGSCGKENINFLIKDEFGKNFLKDIIYQFFSLDIDEGDMPPFLCLGCCDYLKSLRNFDNKVRSVQKMYLEINLGEKLHKKLDLNTYRQKYGLDEINDFKCELEITNPSFNSNLISNVLETEFDSVMDEDWVSPTPTHLETFTQHPKELDSIMNENSIGNGSNNSKDICSKKSILIEKIQCEVCPKVFAQMSRYLLHLKKKHKIFKSLPPEIIQNKIQDPINCKLCGKICGNRGAYVTHMQKKHKNAEIDGPKLYECSVCSKTFTQKMSLTKHEDIHLPKEQRVLFPCSKCEKKFLNEYLLEAHVKIVHLKEKSFVCEICGKGTTSKRSLEDHKLVHVEATFKCEICSQLFKNKQRLKVHMKSHENFNVPCLLCNIRLKNNQSLKEHMLVHSDVKNFKCPLCGNTFRCRRNLRAHMLTHTGLKPYHCSFCDVSYANRSNCKKHEKHAHPQEYAEMEAKGIKVHSKNVPNFHELKQMMERMKQKLD